MRQLGRKYYALNGQISEARGWLDQVQLQMVQDCLNHVLLKSKKGMTETLLALKQAEEEILATNGGWKLILFLCYFKG